MAATFPNAALIQDSTGTLCYRFSLVLRDGDRDIVVDAPELVSKFYSKCTDGLDSATRQTQFTYRCDYGEIIYTRAYDKDESTNFRLQLSFQNRTEHPLKLMRLSPLVVTGEDSLKLGVRPAKCWQLYRQGRQKNDMPSVCTLGIHDGSYEDAQTGLTETGGGTDAMDPSNRFISDQLTILHDGENTLTLAFLTGADQMLETVLEMTDQDVFSSLCCSSLPKCTVQPGQTIVSEWLRVDRRSDPITAATNFSKDKAAIYHARRTPKAPTVFCTWYYYGLSVTYEDVLRDLNGLKRRGIPFDVFQVDEGWERVLGDWRPNQKFPSSMQEVASKIAGEGFIPGIWTSPFIAHATAPLSKEHPEWLLRDKEGNLCQFPMNATTYNVLDITNPEVVEWVRQLYAMLRQWGFQYHKLDFTRAPVIQNEPVFFDDSISIAAAYRKAIAAVREGAGEDAYILICGGLYDPVIGLVDAQRTGSDVMSMWSSTIRQGGRTAPYTIKQNLLRFWMNDWWHNDPDALMIRRRKEPFRDSPLGYGLLNDDEALTSTLNQYIGGGLVCSTEPMDEIEQDRLSLLRHILPTVPVRPIPRDLFQSAARYPSVIDVAVVEKGWHTVALINWSDTEEKSPVLHCDSELLGDFAQPDKTYTFCEFFSGQVVDDIRYGDTVSFGAIPPHGCMLVKVMVTNPNWPQIIQSTGHFSFGGEASCYLCKKGKLVFELDWKMDCPVRYTVRLPKWFHFEKLPEQVTYQREGHCVVIQITEKGKYRIVL